MKDHQCMARNVDNTARCARRATKMVATKGALKYLPETSEMAELDPSVPTLRICGICLRRLNSGSMSCYLELDDGASHLAYVSSDEQDRWLIRTNAVNRSDWE